MQTSVARRQRHRRLGSARRPRGNTLGVIGAAALALPIMLFTVLLGLGFVGFTGVVTAYNTFAKDLPDPQTALEQLDFTQQTEVYDRTGRVVLARLGDQKREVVTYDDIPPELVDATTAIEDKTFWENAGFDPFGIVAAAIDTANGTGRGASTITQQLVRARLLPQSAFDGSVYERKIKEIIQSIRLTQAYSGVEGKQRIITAYLNQNFYGNQSYGVQAAAQGYFGKDVKHLTLAQMAIIAAIPQAPTTYDLIRNAAEQTVKDSKGNEHTELVVSPETPIVRRRNQVLEFMKTRSVLSGTKHTISEYDAAMAEPVVLSTQAAERWRAPQFVWQVRHELGGILCGQAKADSCEKIDTGGYQVATTLDWNMQRTVERWVYAAAIGTNSANPNTIFRSRRIPKSEWGWLRNLRGRNIHNAASAVMDYRTGEVLAYAGSASFTGKGNRRFQPQFDVLSDGWRQPGSSIKPIDYLIGIQDRTMTASTLFIDTVTNFSPGGAKPFRPTQADHLERGPVRLRSALQFSLNSPAIKAGFLNGIKHQYERTKDFGLHYAPGTGPVISESIGTLEIHPIDLTGAYGAIANGGVLMPRHMIREVRDARGDVVWPTSAKPAAGKRVASAAAAYIITDILAGNTNMHVNPFWGKWQITNGVTNKRVRPAAYKTGTTSDNRDVHAYGFVAPPKDKNAPALVVGVWMGNSNNEPNNGSLSLDSSAPLWSAILSEVSKGMPFASFQPPSSGLVRARVDAFTGFAPGPGTSKTVTEYFLPNTQPTGPAHFTSFVAIDAATGLRWQNGCIGPRVTRSFTNYALAEPNFRGWRAADANWMARAAHHGAGTTVFYNSQWHPFGTSFGSSFPPAGFCQIAPALPPPCDVTNTCVSGPPPPQPLPSLPLPKPKPDPHPKPTKPPKP
ncbi:MAG: transglycosylase domain-containing protein [Chloroflexota bacterium]